MSLQDWLGDTIETHRRLIDSNIASAEQQLDRIPKYIDKKDCKRVLNRFLSAEDYLGRARAHKLSSQYQPYYPDELVEVERVFYRHLGEFEKLCMK